MTDGETDISRQDIAQTLRAGTAAATVVGEELHRKADRSTVWIAAVTAALVSSALSIAVAVPGAIAGARQETTNATVAAAQEENRERADAAYQAAVAANEELKRRGQPEVSVPEPDGDGDDLDTLVPAAVAGTLAALPEHVRAPTADELGRAIATYMSANPPPGPSAAQIAREVSEYLTANPPPPGAAGEPGEQGEPGEACTPDIEACRGPAGQDAPPPTPGQIEAAVAAELAKNPDLLCTSTGGTWKRLENVVQDPTPNDLVGGDATTITIWACMPSE